ncbi:DUF6497 family protein [Thalassococcus lentus]|uniref:DUF6497 family protein n=1 Tax=Thalassococcus lentus TaxID=1210524 RepID=A0ABT4XVD2_9RHOB|nr:DUF6497 family protein [Thalassococcus lentus]MDA7425883.1 DUF6497 family protein [Thalassococcus lentus]
MNAPLPVSYTPAAARGNAAPAGGARKRGRGCILSILMALVGSAALAEKMDVPSGLDVQFHDMIHNEMGDGLTYRFRFVAPDIGKPGHDFMSVNTDMEFLCTEYALPRVSNIGPQPSRIVVTFMQEPVEFGVANPEVVQFFESYSIENDLCIWEVF